MGRLTSDGLDGVLVRKVKDLLRRAAEDSRTPDYVLENQYESFVKHLDTSDPVARKAISFLVKDVQAQAKRRKLAIDAVTGRTLAPSCPDEVSRPVRSPVIREWTGRWGDIITNGSDYNNPNTNAARRQVEASEYDAIIADAQRRVASPLPLPGENSSSGWGNANQTYWNASSDAGNWGVLDTEFTDFTDSGDEEAERVRVAENTLARAQSLRDASQPPSAARRGGRHPSLVSRHAIFERAERWRRNRLEQLNPERRAHPTSWERWDHGSVPVNDAFPIVIGGDFSSMPTSITRSSNDTTRANYQPLQRSNSIRRSGFHTSSSAPALSAFEQNQPPPTSSSRAVNGDSARSILRSLSAAANEAGRRSRFASPNAPSSSALVSLSERAESFQEHARSSRHSSRAAREADLESENLHANDMAQPPFFPRSTDPMLSSSTDNEAISELLGSSSSTAALGASPGRAAVSLQSYQDSNDRSLVVPGAPILSRRAFPIGHTLHLPMPPSPTSPYVHDTVSAPSSTAFQTVNIRWPTPPLPPSPTLEGSRVPDASIGPNLNLPVLPGTSAIGADEVISLEQFLQENPH